MINPIAPPPGSAPVYVAIGYTESCFSEADLSIERFFEEISRVG